MSAEEQHKCLHSPTRCWRLAERNGKNGKNGHCSDAFSEEEEAEADEAART